MNPLGLDPGRFRVAVTEADEIVGFAQLLPHNDTVGELRSLFVKEPHRKAGVGSELVKQLVTNRDTPQVWLVTPSYRTSFYERAGFRAVPPWQVPGTMKVDIVLGAAVLAVVARSGIAGMTLRETMSSTDES